MVGSISKAVSPGLFRGGAMSGSGMSELGGVFSQRVVRTCSSVWPSRLDPRQVWGEEARVAGSQADAPYVVIGTRFGESAFASVQ